MINRIISNRLRFSSFMTHNIKRRLPKCKMLINNTLRNYKRRTEFCNQTTILCLRSMRLSQETRIKMSIALNERSKSCNKVRRNFKRLLNSLSKSEIDEWQTIMLNLRRNEIFINRNCQRLMVRLEKRIRSEILRCLSLRRKRLSIRWRLIIWQVNFRNQMKMSNDLRENLRIWTRRMSVSRLK